MNNFNEFLSKKLSEKKASGKLRALHPIQKKKNGKILIDNKWYHDFASNDYLGLASMPAKSSIKGASASRLLSGNRKYYEQIENEFARHRGKHSALFFSSGYSANISIIPAIIDKKGAVFMDRLCHASLIDGARLSGSRILRYKHNDIRHLEQLLKKHRNAFDNAMIITETLFSMDGDFSPLPEIKKLAKKHNCWLYVDEAHSVGIWDIDTSGIDILVGTFGKAFGMWGAYVCGSKTLIRFLVNNCRGFIFSTGMPGILFAEVERRMQYILSHPAIKEKLFTNMKLFSSLMGREIPSQIEPVIIGSSHKAKKASEFLFRNNIFAPAIRPPTVPENTARLRISLSSKHSQTAIKLLSKLLKDIQK